MSLRSYLLIFVEEGHEILRFGESHPEIFIFFYSEGEGSMLPSSDLLLMKMNVLEHIQTHTFSFLLLFMIVERHDGDCW